MSTASSRPKAMVAAATRTAYFCNERRPGMVLRVPVTRACQKTDISIEVRGAGHAAQMCRPVQRRALRRPEWLGFCRGCGRCHAGLEQRAVTGADFKLHLSIHQRESQSWPDRVRPAHHPDAPPDAARPPHRQEQWCAVVRVPARPRSSSKAMRTGSTSHRVRQCRQGLDLVNAHFECWYEIKGAMTISCALDRG